MGQKQRESHEKILKKANWIDLCKQNNQLLCDYIDNLCSREHDDNNDNDYINIDWVITIRQQILFIA